MPEDFRRMFSRERHTTWIRRTLRTPGILIFGAVMGPCGWILNLVCTVAPNWRTFGSIPQQPASYVIEQGVWDVCSTNTAGVQQSCNLQDATYFNDNTVVKVAQGMMVGSLVVTLIGLGFAIPGLRCWAEKPQWVVCAIAGFLFFSSGVLVIIPVAWYTYGIGSITSVYLQNGVTIRVGYCIILGYIGGIFEVLGGIVMMVGIVRCCGGRNRGERRLDEEIVRQHRRRHPEQYQQPPPKPEPRRVEVPSLSRTRSSAGSSVPYTRDNLDDDVSFPRAKTPGGQSGNSSFNGRPYDADL
ncbi:claudin-23 [Austrofundulus limnaeus]|uniref:Claudin-23 n=1 Tax=Austrofundulus limnaeus TaxID=52670 RepID=A0A2I4AHH9_AUSLI|nr:PREDICTED: claudin-23-like [Austrofundulus limnaeus]